jgi:hypothetical protein
MITVWLAGWAITALIFGLMTIIMGALALGFRDEELSRIALLCLAGTAASIAWFLLIPAALVVLVGKLMKQTIKE